MSRYPMVKMGRFLTHRKEFITIDDFQEYKRARVKLHGKGIVLRDIVEGAALRTKKQQVARADEFLVAEIDAKVGGFGVVPPELDGAIVSSHYFLFEIDNTICLPEWLDWYARGDFLKAQVPARGSTNYAAIRPRHVLEFEIPLPPLEEQRRIVARIEALAGKITAARQLRQEAVEDAKDLLETSIQAHFDDIKSANYTMLKELATKIGSGSTPRGGRANYQDKGIPFIRSLNVRMRRFQWDGIVFISPTIHNKMAGTKVFPGDVLLNITGASIGRVACVPDSLVDGNVNQHVAIIRPTDALHPRFLMYWLSQPKVQKFINEEQKGATRQGFTKRQIEQLKIPDVPLSTQRRIVAYLDELQAKVDALRALQAETQAELESLLPSVLDRAFKGAL